MKRFKAALLSILLLLGILPLGTTVLASGTLQIITPVAAGVATGSQFFPLERAFDSTDMSVNTTTGVPSGGPGALEAPAYSNRVGYLDFGTDWADVRITATWTKYRVSSGGNSTPYAEIWWDDDKDTTNDSGLTETRINFNSAQGLSTGSTTPWIQDSDVSSNPVAPLARYMMLRSPNPQTNRASEYAIVGWYNEPVTAITVSSSASIINTDNGTLQMSAQVTPSNASNSSVTWTVQSGTGSATISSSGLLTAVTDGTVTVKATAQDGSGVFGTKVITIYNQNAGNEVLQIISPSLAGVATGSSFFPMERGFDAQPTLDVNTGGPTGGTGGVDAPAYSTRYGYIDFGADWNKVKITSTWTKYRISSSGNQTPYAELWWDSDINTTNDSGFTETRINFNSAQNLSTGSTTPWVLDNDVSSSPVTPKARYLLAKSPATMTNRASEYAIMGWMDQNANGVQDAPFTPVTAISVSGAGGATSLLTNATLQMSAAVLPFTATNKAVTWSVVNGTGTATINSSGLLTAGAQGTVNVKATAQDGSGVMGTQEIVISQYRSFTLPVQGNTSIYYPDLQASFPQVNWQTLERLYIPAGTYQYVKLGNLPQRSSANPLIITNYGGQVKVSGTYNYTLSIEGGSHWILTGKYDNTLKTGHSSFQGHLNGNYTTSTGKYGIEVGRNDSNGLAVGKSATNFELSYIEVAHAGFAGLLIKTDGVPAATMDGVKIHDMYIHDAESEGMYIGNTGDVNTQHLFTNLEIYNNRVLRSGTEGIQLSNMGDGVKVHNNVVVMSSLDWKDPFQIWQDGVFQYGQRSGSAEIHHNVFIGGASSLFSMRFYAATTDTLDPTDEVYMHDNYFSHSRDILAYVHNTASNYATKFRFENNTIRQLNFHYDELPGTHVNGNKMLYVQDNTNNTMTINNNTRDGAQVFIDAVGGNNGTTSNITASGNTTVSNLAPIVFKNVTPFSSSFDWSKVERWDDYSDLYLAPIYFNYGDYVYYFPTGALYECIEAGTHTGKNPETNPTTWRLVTPMTEDFRLDVTSPYQGIGLLN